jgi:hypothetical protein
MDGVESLMKRNSAALRRTTAGIVCSPNTPMVAAMAMVASLQDSTFALCKRDCLVKSGKRIGRGGYFSTYLEIRVEYIIYPNLFESKSPSS